MSILNNPTTNTSSQVKITLDKVMIIQAQAIATLNPITNTPNNLIVIINKTIMITHHQCLQIIILNLINIPKMIITIITATKINLSILNNQCNKLINSNIKTIRGISNRGVININDN